LAWPGQRTNVPGSETPGIIFMKMRSLFALAAALLAVACNPAPKADKPANAPTSIRLAADWVAEAEHGGYYQALATGEYAKRGLDVKIIPGGPGVNVSQLVVTGAVELGIGSNSFQVLTLAEQKAPVKAVAAFMQKDPQVLIAHPDVGINSIADMKGHPILLSDASVTGIWLWMKSKYGFTDDQVRKYNNSNAPFIADKRVVQQGYLMSEPYTIEKQGGIKAKVFLLNDEGYPGYGSLVLAPNAFLAKNPEAVKAFVEATAAGWQSYLHGDPKPGDDLILKANPEMSEDVLAQARELMRNTGLIESGDAATAGIGAMTDARWDAFYKMATDHKVYPATLDYKSAYTMDYLSKPAAPK
jgi:NitT/TauT family transport system substrate-binding protein